jgi:hypothetical protein
MVKHQFYSDGMVRIAVVLWAQRKRLLVLPLMAVLLILTVGSVGQAAEQSVLLNISEPANGTHFVVGESPVATVTLPDQHIREDYSQLRFQVHGPMETTQSKTAVKLLNASTDRSARPHHYIDLVADPNVDAKGNVLTYNLQAVSDEEPGTYTAGLWAVMNDSTVQSFPLFDFQIGTDIVETEIVEREKCAACHLGADSGQYYFHHVDPRSAGSFGYPSIDSWAVKTCKGCHNTDGYAAYRDPEDSSVRIADPIVHRVHGVHKGEGLENPRNNDPVTGIFSDYIHVKFPADVRNCTTCHVDDRWKTEPSRLACGSCHDNIWFGALAEMPATAELHPGGQQLNDGGCSFCHPADMGGARGIADAHGIDLSTEFAVELGMTLPANETHYVTGEMPQITITIKDASTGAVVDPATITEADWSRLRLQVSGPREHTGPALTSAAADHSLSGSTSYIYNDLRVRTDPNNEDPSAVRSATDITYQLADVNGLDAGTYTVFVQTRFVDSPSSVGVLNFQVGTETEEQEICTNCSDCHGETKMHGSYPFNPDVCKNCHDYQNQLAGKTGWEDRNWGFGAAPLSRRIHGVHFGHYLNKPLEVYARPDRFDASTIIFPQDVRNCTKCHADNPMWKEESSRLACVSCHDSDEAIYKAQLMTFDLTEDDPYSGDEVETCVICHGSGSDFSPDKMHNISDPYKPPYPREREGG